MYLAKRRSLSLSLAICLPLAFHPAPARAQATPPASAPATQVTPVPTGQNAPTTPAPPTRAQPGPAAPVPPPNAAPRDGEPEQDSPGTIGEASAEFVELPSHPTAMLAGTAKWDGGFVAIKGSLGKIEQALNKIGLKPGGSPFAVFTQTDDNGFSYEAMVPLVAKPAAALPDDVQLSSSPSGKAIKFQHRGPYDDIDSTYDLITAYLDEKNLEARDFFVEEYLSELTSAQDPNLAVDIYVFLK